MVSPYLFKFDAPPPEFGLMGPYQLAKDFTLLAKAHNIDGEVVEKPDDLKAAIKRGLAATSAGRAYLLDVHTERWGKGGEHEWHPEISIADMRTRDV